MKVFVCKREMGQWETYSEVFAVVDSVEKAMELCKGFDEDWVEMEVE